MDRDSSWLSFEGAGKAGPGAELKPARVSKGEKVRAGVPELGPASYFNMMEFLSSALCNHCI